MSFDGLYRFPVPEGLQPMDNQRERFNFLLSHPRAFDFSEMRTGKTWTALWSLDFLLRQAGGSALVIAPRTTLFSVWAKACNELFGRSGYRKWGVLRGSARQRAEAIRKNQDTIFITNPAALLMEEFCEAVANTNIGAFVVDECTCFKNSRAAQSKHARALMHGAIAWGLTATPMPNEPLEAYGLATCFVEGYRESIRRFKDRTYTRVGQWTWVPRPDAMQTAYRLLQPAIRVKQEDCFAIPASLPVPLDVEMAPEQAKAFKALRNHALLELQKGTVTAANEAVLRSKLLQVAGGSVISDSGVEHIAAGPRFNTLADILDWVPPDAKVLIFAPYRGQVMAVTRWLQDQEQSVACMHGDVPDKQREAIIAGFEDDTGARIIVADPRCMAHGLELSRASIVVWWIPVDSNELYTQACGRVQGRKQEREIIVFQMMSSPLERKIYAMRDSRERNQAGLQALLEAGDDTNAFTIG